MEQLFFDWYTDLPVEIPIQLLRSEDELSASIGARLTTEEKADLITACRIAYARSGETAFWEEVCQRMDIEERSKQTEDDLNS